MHRMHVVNVYNVYNVRVQCIYTPYIYIYVYNWLDNSQVRLYKDIQMYMYLHIRYTHVQI